MSLVYYLHLTSTAKKLLIEGIPVQENENLKNIFMLISCVLGAGCNWDEEIESICRSLDKDQVIVNFKTKKAKDRFYQSYIIKDKLTLEDILIKSSDLIVISECVTPKCSNILQNARLLKNENLIQNTYSLNGFVYIIPLGKTATVRINNIEELHSMYPDLFWLEGSTYNLKVGNLRRNLIRSNSLPCLLDGKLEDEKMREVFVI